MVGVVVQLYSFRENKAYLFLALECEHPPDCSALERIPDVTYSWKYTQLIAVFETSLTFSVHYCQPCQWHQLPPTHFFLNQPRTSLRDHSLASSPTDIICQMGDSCFKYGNCGFDLQVVTLGADTGYRSNKLKLCKNQNPLITSSVVSVWEQSMRVW